MSKLYFKHGTVGSAKTLNLLAVAHNYKQNNSRVILIKPKLDDRFGANIIKTRAGLETTADILVSSDDVEINFPSLENISCILVDEVQFLPTSVIDQLHKISFQLPVMCYGLRTDFRCNLFPAAKRLFELADSIEEIKTICAFCINKKAKFNLKLINGIPTLDGPSIELGCEEKYLPACGKCFYEKHELINLF